MDRNPIRQLTRLVPITGLAPVAGLLASAAALSAAQVVPHDAAETAFLALVAAIALTGTAFLDRHPSSWILPSASVATFAALWALPGGEVRGAAVWLILTSAIALAAGSRVAEGSETPTEIFVALALSAQALLRPELWLTSDWSLSFLSSAIFLPAIVGLAIAEWVRDRPRHLPVGAALVVALQPGVTPEIAVVFTLFAASRAAIESRRTTLLWIALAVGVAVGHSSALAAILTPESGRVDFVRGFSWLVLLVPAAIQPTSGGLGRRIVGLGLAPIAILLLPENVALAAPLLLLFESVAWRSGIGRLQASWSAAVVLGSTLAAGYPWLSGQPVERALSLLRLEVDGLSAAALAIAFWALVAATRLYSRRRSTGAAGLHGRFAAIALGTGLLLGTLPTQRALLDEPFIVSGSTPSRAVPALERFTEVIVDSYISNGAAVAPGTPIANVIVVGSDGREHLRVLRAGLDSGEWAARRPGFSPVATPEPWVSWLAPEGGYFAQRYRARWRMSSPVSAEQVRVERVEGVPGEVELAVFHIGVRR